MPLIPTTMTSRLNAAYNPKGPGDTLHRLFSELGIFSNIIVSASYHKRSGRLLSANLLYKSLQLVIEEHPALAIITQRQPSLKKAGSRRLWKARLKSINMEDCVSFIDGFDDSEPGMRKLLEKAHNEWFDTEAKMPLWKLIVVNRFRVLFIFHHSVCDGIGGTEFHRSLLTALNKFAKDDVISTSCGLTVNTPDTPLSMDAIQIFQEQKRSTSMLRIVLLYVWLLVLRFCLRKKDWVFSDAVYTMAVPDMAGTRSDEERSVTRLQSLCLSPPVLAKCLDACKKNQTTFTSLLVTLIDTTLATDIYPASKYRILATQINLRRYVKQEDNVTNLASTITQASPIGAHRKAGKEPSSLSPDSVSPTETRLVEGEVVMEHDLFWELARKHHATLKKALAENKNTTPVPIQDLLLLSTAGEGEEALAAHVFPGIGVMAERAYSISNLGAFEQQTDGDGDQGGEETGPWRIGAIEFSCAATKPCCGYVLYFAVLSLKGGACMINITHVKGVLEDERVTMMIDRIEQRLNALLEIS